ncbi:MAG: M23 family metallopeptidase [Bacteroidales bacterium]
MKQKRANIRFIITLILLFIIVKTYAEPTVDISFKLKPPKSIESILFRLCKEIPPIYEEIKTTEFSDMPEEYDIWNSNAINPYKVSLVDMPDTVKIDVSKYCPPTLKHVTSNWGFRKWKYHYGIDLKVHKGDTVKCAFDGTVRVTRRDRGYGFFVVVRHANGLETLYGHLDRIMAHSEQELKAGEPIGLGGNTGRSTGYHLHFEFRYLGNPINPNDIVDFNSKTIKNDVFLLSAKNFEYKKEIDKIRYWTIKSGDTLGRIALRTGVPINKLCSLNKIKKTTILKIGRRIRYT